MVNPLPAVLIGGPPHAGKSVLTYNLTQALRQREIAHYVLRANPDGEGDWSQEMNQNIVDLVRVTGKWTPDFVTRMCVDLERRQLPLLVDAGGLPTENEIPLFRQCTHYLLLLRADPESEPVNRYWLDLVRSNTLTPLAQIYSKRDGASTITSTAPILEGTLTGLDRGSRPIQGLLFEALVERLYALFAPHTIEGLEQTHLGIAPTEHIVNLDTLLQEWASQSARWEPTMIQRLLDVIPADAPLAVYGRGTNWLYGAIAAWTGVQPLHQFDSRLGWVTPPSLRFGASRSPAVRVSADMYDNTTVLTVRLANDYLDYGEAEQLSFPPVPAEYGLVLSGKLPYWLVTALVRLYAMAGVPWIACYQPQLNGAVVVMSHVVSHSTGDLIPIFWT